MPIEISLTKEDMEWADRIATNRQDEAVKAGKRDSHGFNGIDGLNKHKLGAAGELAVAKALGVIWDATVNTYKAPDLGECVQVRTRSKHDYDMLVRANDKDDEVFIHVTGQPPNLIVHGWLYGKDAKQEKWKQNYGNRPSAYFIPTSELNQLVVTVSSVSEVEG